MKKTVIFSLFLITLTCIRIPAAAQSLRPWSEGPLRWEEFQRGAAATGVNGVITWQDSIRVVKDGYKSYRYRDLHSFFNSSYSSAEPELMTETQLKRQQDFFDLSEYYARKLRDTCLTGIGNYESVRNTFWQNCLEDFEQGKTDPATVAGELQKEPFSPKSFSYTTKRTSFFNLAFDNRFLTLADDRFSFYAPSVSLEGGFKWRWYSILFGVELGLENKIDFKTKASSWSAQYLSFGLDLYKTERFCVTGYLGGGIAMLKMKKAGANIVISHERPVSRLIFRGDYLLRSFIHFDKASPSRDDIRLFVSVGSDQMYFPEQMSLTFPVLIGVSINSSRIKLQ